VAERTMRMGISRVPIRSGEKSKLIICGAKLS
jgi:hypothetical protein